MPSPALILFDIDGTLLRRAGPHHRQALVDAVRDVTGLETTTEGVPVHGMLDPDILTQMMRNAGAKPALIRRALPAIMGGAQARYVDCCPDLRRRTTPHARNVLWKLTRRKLPLGLVTGNLPQIGWMKMQRAGLRDRFRYGMFAGMASTRAGLAKLAIKHAREQQWIDRKARVALIGDSPNDVIAAKANGIVSIAVRTGLSTRNELKAEKPDYLIETLGDFDLDMVL